MNKVIEVIGSKISAGQRLSDEDALELFKSQDLVSIGELADRVKQKWHGSKVFFNINRHINPTNICVLSCKFCSFQRKPGDEGAYALWNPRHRAPAA